MKRASVMTRWCLLGLVTATPVRSGHAQQKEAAPVQARREAVVEDETALRALVAEFTKSFNGGDAKAVASLFAGHARIVTVTGHAIEGRDAIEKLFTTAFAENAGQTIEVKTESLRFLGAAAALEEGKATITIPPSASEPQGSTETTRYTAAYVKRDGKWLQESIRDYPLAESTGELTAHDHLKELDWMVGEWIDESDEAEVHTTCRWAENQSFLLRAFQVRIRGKAATSGSQRIGWDPRLNQIRSWVFDSDGGFSEQLWSKEGERWVIKSTGVLKDGRAASATNIFTRVGRDSVKWTSVDRTLGADVLPDAEEITLVRKPPQPRTNRGRSTPTTPQRPQP